MSVSSIGGSASQLWQLLKESQAQASTQASTQAKPASTGFDGPSASATGASSGGSAAG